MSEKVKNGVDLDALGQLVAKMSEDPSQAAFDFRSASQWEGGAVISSSFDGHKQAGADRQRARPHSLGGDEPAGLLGTDKHVGPSGHLLHAMGHCLSVTTAYHGAARGVEIEALRVEASGSLDLNGFLAKNDRVRPGFKHIHLDVHIASPNSTEEVSDLLQYAQGRSPICSTVRYPTEIRWEFEVEASGAEPDEGTVRHGVDFEALSATLAAVDANPSLAKCKFYATVEWQGGAQVRSSHSAWDQGEGDGTIEHRSPTPLSYVGDEPAELLGGDAGPSPSETLLHAMANCVSVTNSYHSAAAAIALDKFEVDFEGSMDLQGFSDLDDRVSPGYRDIRAKVRIKGGGDQASLESFTSAATALSPMCDSVAKPVHVTFGLVHNGSRVG